MLKVTLVKSLIGGVPRNRRTVHALGLRKIGQSNIVPDNASIRGMVHHVKHLVTCVEVEEESTKPKKVVKAKVVEPVVAEPVVEAPKPKRKTTKKTEETQES